MGSRIPQSIAPPTIDQSAGKGFRPWLGWPLGAIAASAAAITAGALAWGLHWIVVADLAPLLFILPCAAIMALCVTNSSKAH